MEQTIITILAFMTIGAHIGLAIVFAAWIASQITHNNYLEPIKKLARKYGLWILFAIPLFSILSSLFFSQIADFAPCELCWYQRMFMYPQALLTTAALIRKKKDIIPYLALMSAAGAIVSAYQWAGQMTSLYGTKDILSCSSIGVSCSNIYVLEFGYITIPLMTFTAFILILAVSLIAKNTDE